MITRAWWICIELSTQMTWCRSGYRWMKCSQRGEAGTFSVTTLFHNISLTSLVFKARWSMQLRSLKLPLWGLLLSVKDWHLYTWAYWRGLCTEYKTVPRNSPTFTWISEKHLKLLVNIIHKKEETIKGKSMGFLPKCVGRKCRCWTKRKKVEEKLHNSDYPKNVTEEYWGVYPNACMCQLFIELAYHGAADALKCFMITSSLSFLCEETDRICIADWWCWKMCWAEEKPLRLPRRCYKRKSRGGEVKRHQ